MWNWDSSQWKKSSKVLLGIATIWPLIYMFLFIGSILSMFLFLPFAENRAKNSCGKLDVLQLDRKIKDGQEGLFDEIELATRQLVKRQRTWFRGQCPDAPYTQWFQLDGDRTRLEEEIRSVYRNE